MIKKTKEKEIAIKLRRLGKTYLEILRVVHVAKSTLAIWLKEVGLSVPEKQTFSEIKRMASLRGGQAKKKQRLERQNFIISKSKSEILSISERELFLTGIILYWAEGTKEKEHHPGSQLQFSNMDPKMIRIFLIWLLKTCKIDKNMIVFNIFLHKTHKKRVEEIKRHWSRITNFPVSNFNTIYWKKNKNKTKRKNTKENYYGVLKIKVRKSSVLVRKIAGWVDGIFENIVNR